MGRTVRGSTAVTGAWGAAILPRPAARSSRKAAPVRPRRPRSGSHRPPAGRPQGHVHAGAGV